MDYHKRITTSDLPKPIQNVVPTDEALIDETATPKDAVPVIEEQASSDTTINPLDSPALFRVFRKAILNTELVSNFINQQAKKLDNPLPQIAESNVIWYLRRVMIPDKQFKGEIQTKLSGIPFSLTEDLKRRISSTNLLLESVVMLKMLFCLEDKDEIFHQLMIPYIEERSNLGDDKTVQSNKRFYLSFLKALHEGDLEEILLNLRYEEIIRADNFAFALLQIAEPKLIVDVLVWTLERYTTNSNLSQKDELTAIETVQKSLLTILENETARVKLKDETLQHLQTLYMSSKSKMISDRVAKLLSSNYEEAGKEIFLRQLKEIIKLEEAVNGTSEENRQMMFDDKSEINKEIIIDDTSVENGKRRYVAVNHLVNITNYDSKAVEYLKGFILKEKDSFVLGNAVYLLANNLGESGKKALVEVIVEQVKNDIPSLPLACLNSLYISKGQNTYLNLIKEIFSSDYTRKGTLQAAFEDIAEEYLCPVLPELNSDFLFNPVNRKQDSEQVINLIECIGPEIFFSWVLLDKKEDKILRKNAEDILNYACEVNPERIYRLALMALINEPTATTELAKKLGGVGQMGNPNEVANKINTYHLRN